MIHLPNPIKQVLHTLHLQGYQAYVVGGCVRDALIGRETNDYDITTNALPATTIEIFNQYPIIETGIKHGTVTVIVQDIPIEITTYRIDGLYSDYRRPDKVEFAQELREDLERRDFTINAMAYNETSGIIDFFHGKQDIKNKTIRCVGNPDRRFQEDALRIIRALRFSSTLGFHIDQNTSLSIHNNKNLLIHIAIERVTVEFSKMICGENIEYILLNYFNVITIIIPNLQNIFELEKWNESKFEDLFSHTIRMMLNTPSILHLRLAALLHYITSQNSNNQEGKEYHNHKESAEMAKKILQNMRYDKDTIQRVYTLILHFNLQLDVNQKYVKRWMKKLTPIALKDILLLQKAHELAFDFKSIQKLQVIEKMDKLIDQILIEGTCYEINGLAISGNEILKLGVQPGEVVGKLLAYLLDEVIEENVANTKEDLIKLAQSYLMKRTNETHKN